MIRVSVPCGADTSIADFQRDVERHLQEAGIPHRDGRLERGSMRCEVSPDQTVLIYTWIDIEATPFVPGSMTPG